MEVGGRTLVSGASFSFRAGDKVGLVGRNGAGKTSLLKVLSGELARRRRHQGDGRARLPHPGPSPTGHRGRGHRVAACPVAAASSTRPRCGWKSSAWRWRRTPPSGPSIATPGPRNGSRRPEVTRQRRRSASSWPGLGWPPTAWTCPSGVLSGGERRRLELARILFAGSDVLLLDEPTNHLDSDAKGWLVGFLRSYRGALLVVSHDIELLDESITRVLHLDEGALVEYKGTYSQYREARAKDEARQAKVAERQSAEIKRLSTLADSMRHQTAKRARVAKTPRQAGRPPARRRPRPRPATGERRYKVTFPAPPHTGRVVRRSRRPARGYDGPPVFEDVSFTVERGQRLLVMGLNGAGKTSLLRILAGLSAPDQR